MDDNNNKSIIGEFYAGKSVFVTGSTGFMGKVLIEKLLYSCSDIGRIYMLMRPKRGKAIETRLDEMFQSPMFNRIKKEKPQVLKKLYPVQGDVTQDKLGLSAEHEQLLVNEVDILFHAAATLKLEANLTDACEMNTTGTQRVLDLAKKMKKLKAFLHLSTAFCHVDVEVLEERIYDCPFDPEEIMRLCRWMEPKVLDKITPELIAPHPNTYTFTKRLAERLVADHFDTLPVCICRPSIVTSSWKEPIPGWVDNLNGPVGVTVAAGKGVLRSMYCKPDYTAEVIPVDFAIAGLIEIARKIYVEKKPKEIPVYNITKYADRNMTWGEVLEKGREITWEYPFDLVLWYPDGNLRSNYWIHKICCIFLHWIPAYFIDFLLFIFRQKRFMIRVQEKISQGLDVLQYFTTHKWTFKNEKYLALRKGMTEIDDKTFFMDMDDVQIDEYMRLIVLGARVFCMKEPLENLPRARRVMKVLWFLDRLTHLLFYMFVAYWIISWSGSFKSMFETVGKNVPFVRTLLYNDMPTPRH